MNVGCFSIHQNKMKDTDRYKGQFFTARVSQVNVNTMKTTFEQWSELQVAKRLLLHVLPSTYNAFSFEISNENRSNAAKGPS